jgi:hypothetical protein
LTLRLFAAATVAGLALAACSAGTAPPPVAVEPGPTLSKLPPVTTDRALCPAAYPNPLAVQPESADEAMVQATLVICTGRPTDDRPYGKGIFLRNVSDAAVWLIDQPDMLLGLPVMAPYTLQVKTLQSFLQKRRPLRGVTLPPRASFEESTVDHRTVRLSVDSSAQAAWQVLNLAVSSVAEQVRPNAANRIEMAAHRLLGSTAPGREAVLTCMAVAYDAGPDIASARNGWHVPQLDASLDLRNPASECAAAIGRAQQVSAVAGFTGGEMMATIGRSLTWFEAEVFFEVAGRGVTPFLPGGQPA